jgi:cell division septation protein DedD
MEQNLQQEPKVKEKSVYLLHLDGPRILILSAIVIGLLSVAFLVGMKFIGDDKSETVTAQNDSILDQQTPAAGGVDSLDPLKAPLPDLEPQANAQQNAAPAQQALVPPQDSVIPQTSNLSQNTKKPEHDALAGGTHEVIPASKKTASAKTKKSTKSKATAVASTKSKKANTVKAKKSVVEVSDTSAEKTKTEKKILHGYFVQLASFDKAEKAKSEVLKLKDIEYDAHYDKKEVKGKDFFCVRIGPIAAKEKALEILDEVQENPRYEESFLVHE